MLAACAVAIAAAFCPMAASKEATEGQAAVRPPLMVPWAVRPVRGLMARANLTNWVADGEVAVVCAVPVVADVVATGVPAVVVLGATEPPGIGVCVGARVAVTVAVAVA